MRKLAFLLIFAACLMAQTSDAPTGRIRPLVLEIVTNAGAHSASTVFTAPTTGYYFVNWSLRTTATGSAGTITALTLAWNNGNAMSRNTMLVGPQVLDLTSLVSVGLTSAEITGTQGMFVTAGTVVTWATTVGVAIVGSPNYTAEFRVVAQN